MEIKALGVLLLAVSSFLVTGAADGAAPPPLSRSPFDHPECSEERLGNCPVYCPRYCLKIGFKSFTCTPEGARTTYCCCTGGRAPTPSRR